MDALLTFWQEYTFIRILVYVILAGIAAWITISTIMFFFIIHSMCKIHKTTLSYEDIMRQFEVEKSNQ